MVTFAEITQISTTALTVALPQHKSLLTEHIFNNMEANLQLWKYEDRARKKDEGFESVAKAKSEIDHHNQVRNELIHLMDLEFARMARDIRPTGKGYRPDRQAGKLPYPSASNVNSNNPSARTTFISKENASASPAHFKKAPISK